MTNKMNRREFLPLAGAGAVLAPTIIAGCSTSTEPDPLSIPGTIVFERDASYESDNRNIYIMDWSTETQINLTADLPGSQGRPFWSPDGLKLYFDSIVDGNCAICRINDLTDPSGSLETIVDEEGHQTYPIVHPDGNLLVYSQTNNLDKLTSGIMVAFDMNSGQELSRTEAQVGRVLDNNKPNDRAFIPGERKVIVTGAPNVGIFDPDTGTIETYEFNSIRYSAMVIHSVAITSDGLTAYGLGLDTHDRILRWGTQPGERNVVGLARNLQIGARMRIMADLIELPGEYILLSSCRPAYVVSSTDPWKIGYTKLGKSSDIANNSANTILFDNMLGSNYWPRFTMVEHI